MREISAVGPEDFQALSVFMASAWGPGGRREFWDSRFRIWWDDNPAFAPQFPRGWALRHEGKIVGFLGNVPSQLKVAGQIVTAVNTTSWIVLPEHRVGSKDLLAKQLELAKETIFFNATPTDAVMPIFQRMGCRPLPWGGALESFLFLDPAACARAKVPLLSRIPGAAQLAGLALFARQASRLSLLSPLRGEVLSDAGPAFDELWERTQDLYDATNVRTANIVRWHCFKDPEFPKVLLGCFDGRRLAGSMILREKTRRGLATLECCDVWLEAKPGECMSALAALVSTAREQADRRGCDLLMLPHFTLDLAEAYGRLGLIQGQAPPRKHLFRAPAELSASIESGRSYFCGLQGDAGSAP